MLHGESALLDFKKLYLQMKTLCMYEECLEQGVEEIKGVLYCPEHMRAVEGR